MPDATTVKSVCAVLRARVSTADKRQYAETERVSVRRCAAILAARSATGPRP